MSAGLHWVNRIAPIDESIDEAMCPGDREDYCRAGTRIQPVLL
ncbi:hypothetical protein N9C27_08595 [Luminiphilus sp.]|nr:hypothetical protein [Luminiphilus sp.]MDA9848918.1 hypothetical protein [Luminiphilus sp.]MDC6485299.1 hypothetical protein [Luminiphilus sp.]